MAENREQRFAETVGGFINGVIGGFNHAFVKYNLTKSPNSVKRKSAIWERIPAIHFNPLMLFPLFNIRRSRPGGVTEKLEKSASAAHTLGCSQVGTPVAHSHKYSPTDYVAYGHGDQVLP